jgi:hypothetical protein
MNQTKKRIGIALALIVLAAVAVASVLAFAESSTPSPSPSATAATTTSFFAKVAKNLGIDESKLEAAIATAEEQSIDEALAAGRITQEQATAMKERLAAEKAMEQVITDGVASGKITQAQADLLGLRSPSGQMMGGRGMLGGGLGAGDGSCGRMGHGIGR